MGIEVRLHHDDDTTKPAPSIPEPSSDDPVADTPLEQAFPWLSTALLVGANLLPLIGVLFFDWSIFAVMFLFWAENVLTGVFNVLRMLICQPDNNPLNIVAKIFMIPFFCFHYGMFCFVHGIFVFAMFGNQAATHAAMRNFNPMSLPDLFRAGLTGNPGMGIALLGMVVNHLVTLFTQFIGHGEYRRVGVSELMSRPYKRVVILHLTIIFGGFLFIATGLKGAAVALLVLLKLGIDLKDHLNEHKRLTGLKGVEPLPLP